MTAKKNEPAKTAEKGPAGKRPAKNKSRDGPSKAYENAAFINSRAGRPLRIISEHLEPEARLKDQGIADTIVFFGSSRIPSRSEARAALKKTRRKKRPSKIEIGRAERAVEMSHYYEDARELAYRLTKWSKGLAGRARDKDCAERRFVVCTGGGPGIMEAANRGASEAHGINIGFNIAIPEEQFQNPYITRELTFEFHYFFMRKFWFVYLAKAMVVFPGGFGTIDEFFEVLTLVQTKKVKKKMPVVLFGASFWDQVIDIEAMARFGTIGPEDLNLFFKTDDTDEAYAFITSELEREWLHLPGGRKELV